MKKSKTSILLAAFLIGGGMLYLQASYPAKEVVQYGVVEEIADNLYEPPEQMEEEAISDTQAELNANDSSPTSEVSNPEEPSQSLGDDTKGT
ncbi:MAG: hypothetical protein LBU27_08040 [Candidatus Peribacteria bacterium]|jgi:hypothetical protein|nr:hypothetical protein [Candidatus Peribacteria bacterium]